MKELKWIGSSKGDLMQFPNDVIKEMGYALFVAQNGGTYEKTKPFKGYGSGVHIPFIPPPHSTDSATLEK